MKNLETLLKIALPVLGWAALMFIVLSLRSTKMEVIPTSSVIEETRTVSPVDRPSEYRFSFTDDGRISARREPILDVGGTILDTPEAFLAALPPGTSVHTAYVTVPRGNLPAGQSGAAARKVYFSLRDTTGADSMLAYTEDYRINVTGFLGSHSVIRWTPDNVTVQWSNWGNIFMALLLMFVLGDLVAVLIAWRLLNPKYRGPRLVTPLDPKRYRATGAKMDRPNVLLICTDHWYGRLIGALGHPAILTPTLDQLIENGIAYTNAYATVPSCIPARREIMTGAFSPTHGDRVFKEYEPMPEGLPTMAQTFRNAGYQAYAVGKLHVYPPRDRIGFDDALLNEEGRHHLGMTKDDYEIFLAEHGYAGQELTHGMGSNDYNARPFHLPEQYTWTNWTAKQMSNYIARRDPSKPAFWYMSFNAPHPPLAPPQHYLDMYADVDIDMPIVGEWARDLAKMPYALRSRRFGQDPYSDAAIRLARQAFYALCTHVDHQVRLVLGLLREEGLLENTAIMFTADHGEMIGNHRQYSKDLFYEEATKIPMVFTPPANRKDMPRNKRDNRLVAQADIMPTLLELCGIPVLETVEGLSMLGEKRHEYLYGEHWEDTRASRMIRDNRFKLIYYPTGNRFQLFDMLNDPDEMQDMSDNPAFADIRESLVNVLKGRLYGQDLRYLDASGNLVGEPEPADDSGPSERALGGQRGWRF
ncbi:MAG: DUF4976 domain-containing protein [SAR202 cluster bacterium]|nr:DUF4976 domain-containing protein [SAR202 cluster bacterium]